MRDELLLAVPAAKHREAVLDYMREHFEAGETALHGASLLEKQPSYEAWLLRLSRNRREKTALPDCVPAATRLVLRRCDGRLVGIVDMRNALNDYLRKFGGHIGYGLRPSERGKGYGTELLRLALRQYERWGIARVMLHCNKENLPSARTILRNGGVLEREYIDPQDGKTGQVYWIELSNVRNEAE